MSRYQTTLSGFPACIEEGQELAVNVAFTSERATAAALRYAAKLASGLGARVRVLVPEVIPYGRDLDDPLVSQEFVADRVIKVERDAGVDADVEIVLCRDRAEGLHDALGHDGVLLIGAGSRWWPFRQKRLARRLARLGHQVLLLEGGKSS
jgi:hypothetical protein